MPRLLGLCALISIAGCQSAAPAPECTGSCVSLEAWCANRLSAETCNNRKACGLAADLTCSELNPWPTFATTADFCPPLVRAAVDAGTVKYDGAAASQCLQSLSTHCGRGPPGCDRVFVGTRSQGEECRTRHDCAPGSWCDLAACPGTCRAKVAAGGTVSSPDGCATVLFAATADGGVVCRDEAGLGEACDPNELSLCADGLSCSSDGGCVDAGAVYRASRGERCSTRFQGVPFISCLDGLACHASDGGSEGTCRSRYSIGEDCSSDKYGCVHNSACESNVCVALGAAGDACVKTFDCRAGLACRAGRCGARAVAGSTCASPFDCQSGLLCTNGKCVAPLCD